MSKSKGNVINPDELVEHYGADAVRLYLCFIGPYDQGGAWNPSGIEGVSRFIRKLHTVLISPTTETEDKDVTVAINKLTKKVTEDIPAMKFNTSVAAFMETINTIGSKALTLDQKNTLILLIAPFCPFISEDIWHTLNSKIDNQSVHRESWPTYNPELLVESVVNIAVQVNGKVRDRIEMPRGATKEEVIQKALSLDTVQKFATNSNIKESFYIQDKLLNIVTN
jgi:leucyl-tRNA synthetase